MKGGQDGFYTVLSLKKVSNSLKALTMDARLTIIGCLCWGISS